ncbi:MAG: XTP/dITP diphosphatase [Clostridia bacterium]|nr:XTP/dITP diphosphatase [Clostridia bacterium]
MKILIATHNKNKIAELQRILLPLGIELVTDRDLGIELTDVEETGSTFTENSFIKSESGCKESGLPCIADDSGLAVDYLNGAPGVFSARYAGEHGNDEMNIDKLLDELKDVPDEKRTARFVCAATCVFPDGKRIAVNGTCEGAIAHERKGNGGFGYDPIFEVNGKTFGETSAEEKDALSHRGKAFRLLAEELEKVI